MPVEILTYNPGFERSSEALGTPNSGWNAFFDSCTPNTVTTSPDTGSRCCEMVAIGANSYIGMNEFWDVDTKLRVYTPYTATWRVKVQTTGNYSPRIQNADGSDETFGGSRSITAGVWTTITIPNCIFTSWVADTKELTFRLEKDAGTYSGETIYYDTMSFTYEAPAVRADYSKFPK